MPAMIPTIGDIARIAALPDPVLRNLQITQCYHRLALVMAERFDNQANWCTFAAWASKQAGQTIRKEDLGRTLEAFLGEGVRLAAAEKFVVAVQRIGIRLERKKLVSLMWKAFRPESAFAHSSDAVARGNLKVFAEIGHEFARFYAACLPDTQYDHANITRFLDELRPGPPPDGQEILRQAFLGYYRALFEPQAKARSELLFLSNLQIGFHEQTRLQPEILEALEAPVISPRDFTQNLLHAYYPNAGWLANTLSGLLSAAGRLVGFSEFVNEYLMGARRQAHRIVTDLMMTIEIPQRTQLRLGKDLPSGFPPVLQHITNTDLQALLARIDPTPDSVRESGAVYWGDLDDRLHFIADMFRCYHTASELLTPPFSPDQVQAIEQGRLPSGRL